MRVIYIDVLFFINTAANYLILLATAKICDTAVSRISITISACLGGIYAVLSSIPNMEFLNLMSIKLAAATVMLVIVFHRHHGLLRISTVFFAVSAAFGGVLYALSASGVHIGIKILIAVFTLAWAGVTLAFRRTGKAESQPTVRLKISFLGTCREINALVDTGNCLKDPLSGTATAILSPDNVYELLPVPIAKLIKGKSPAEAMLSLSDTKYAGRFRLLPYSAVGVLGGMLLAFRPDSIVIDGKPVPGMLAAISPTPVSDGGVYSALVGLDNAYCRRSV